MYETTSTNKFINIEVTALPVPPGTKGTPRPPERVREVFVPDDSAPTDPASVPSLPKAGSAEPTAPDA